MKALSALACFVNRFKSREQVVGWISGVLTRQNSYNCGVRGEENEHKPNKRIESRNIAER